MRSEIIHFDSMLCKTEQVVHDNDIVPTPTINVSYTVPLPVFMTHTEIQTLP